MTRNLKLFDDYEPYTSTDIMMMGTRQNSEIKHIGKVIGDVMLHNVLHVPQLKQNLLSTSQLTFDLNCDFKFHSKGFLVFDRGSGRVIFIGTQS